MPDLDMMGGAPAPQRPDNQEAAMARADLYKSANYSFKLFKMIQDGQELEGWVQAKITKAADYIASVYHYMEYEMKFNEYGKKLEDSDIYTESVKQQFKQKLTEARTKLEKLKTKNISDLEEGWEDMMKASKERADSKGTGKFDRKKSSTGTVYTRKASTYDDGGKDKDQKKAEKKAKSTTEGFGDYKSDNEKGTGKFDKKEIKPGVTRYTRKSSTFTDGGDDKDVKAAKKKAAVKEEADKSKVPAALRKAKGGDWKVSKADLEKEASKSPTTKAGLDAKKKSLGMKEALKGGQKNLDTDKDGKLEKSDFAKLRAAKSVKEAAKPDFLDVDKDGNKKEPMKKAVADKKKTPFAKK